MGPPAFPLRTTEGLKNEPQQRFRGGSSSSKGGPKRVRWLFQCMGWPAFRDTGPNAGMMTSLVDAEELVLCVNVVVGSGHHGGKHRGPCCHHLRGSLLEGSGLD
ncbi:uncharacterized protein ATNIH1004_001989 [Aspergillus tanneri]|uniref:Uncharacterized protein n=1 Tax=Aspergillus tanneri TaxID=1220188 RepID=A0A5M9M3Q2_9EURO|nr:uncharacterized protein ATNIH1004_001989 [Aspergillus tanneri]KAA8641321.1 hypothetical protein ATNIH1004_001989 [Aspergillus tanneri]